MQGGIRAVEQGGQVAHAELVGGGAALGVGGDRLPIFRGAIVQKVQQLGKFRRFQVCRRPLEFALHAIEAALFAGFPFRVAVFRYGGLDGGGDRRDLVRRKGQRAIAHRIQNDRHVEQIRGPSQGAGAMGIGGHRQCKVSRHLGGIFGGHEIAGHMSPRCVVFAAIAQGRRLRIPFGVAGLLGMVAIDKWQCAIARPLSQARIHQNRALGHDLLRRTGTHRRSPVFIQPLPILLHRSECALGLASIGEFLGHSLEQRQGQVALMARIAKNLGHFVVAEPIALDFFGGDRHRLDLPRNI